MLRIKTSAPKNIRNCNEALSRNTVDNKYVTSPVMSVDCKFRNIPDKTRIVEWNSLNSMIVT